MSIAFPKNKAKRSRSSSSEANNSFVKNVTSRVSGLLPAAVTKWFSSPSSSNANGSAATADATDSSTEDEAPESPIDTQPQSKRMRYTSPGNFNHYSPTETNSIATDENEVETSTFGTVQSPPGRATFRRDTNFVSTPLRPGDEASADRTERTDRTDKDSTYKQHTMSTTGSSVATKRKSLFDSPSHAEASVRACAKTANNTIKDPREPCFKPSLLGSPFYPGRTMYGGASSSYINQPNIKRRKNTIVNESNNSDNTISNSTRRIMDLLEHYSSPLNEAKRIPHYTRTPINSSLSSSYSSSSPPSNKVLSYKTQELQVPSIASILRLKQRSRLMDTTTAARQIIASHSSSSDYVPYPSASTRTQENTNQEPSNKLTTKVKSRLTRQKRGDDCNMETDLPPPVNLPSAVLQIDQNDLPKFSFGSPPKPFSTSIVTATSTPATFTKTRTDETKITGTTETPLRKPDIVTSANPYKFSSPVRISSDQSISMPPKFTFGSPERSIDNVKDKTNDDVSNFVGAPKESQNIEVSKEKNWECSDCWVVNKPDKDNCVCCGGKKPSPESKKPNKCTVCKLADSQPLADKCVNCEKIKVNNVSKPLAKSEESSKWKCEDCWVSNEASAQSCVCCGAKNNNAKPAVTSAASSANSEWKCDVCWIKNQSSLEQCASCGAPPPEQKPAATTSAPLTETPDNTFKNIVKTQTDKWECSSCLVRNDGDKTKCVCCETVREGTAVVNDKASFNFGTNANTTFKFGIFPQSQEAGASKATNDKISTDSKKEESEKNNNVLSKTPSFSFGLPAKKPEDQTDSAKKSEEKAETAPKTNFTFGIPKTTPATTTSVTAHVFEIPSKLPDFTAKAKEDDKEKLQVVPKIDLTVPKTQEAPKPLANLFASPLVSSQTSQEKPTASTVVPEKSTTIPALNSTAAVEKNDGSSSGAAAPVATTVASPAFSFGTIKLSSNLFGPPATTSAVSTVSFSSPVQSAPANTTSLFQKSQPVSRTHGISEFPKSNSASLFQKSDAPSSSIAPAPIAMPAAAPAATPMFSFGTGSGQTQPAPADKPKFNFSFGSNKNETSTVFKPPETKFTFGASTENKFSLPTANTLSNANSITGNALGGNGLSTGNALGGNGLPAANALGGNGLPTGNALGGNILGGGNGLPANQLSGGSDMSRNPLTGTSLQTNALQTPSGNIFGSVVQKENMWTTPSNTGNNLFASTAPDASSNPLQKPATFSFGSSTPFNTTSMPTFGASAQSTSNMFGMTNQNSNSQGPLFGSPAQPQSAASVFGAPQGTPTPSLGMFGTPSVGATPTFGTPNPSIPTFEAPSLTPAPAPSFNFGQQQQTGIFGFGQQQQPPTGNVYSFGASPVGAPQFNMGTAPNAAATRRVRKAVRRTQR